MKDWQETNEQGKRRKTTERVKKEGELQLRRGRRRRGEVNKGKIGQFKGTRRERLD